MIVIFTSNKAQKYLREYLKGRRLRMGLTQEGLANRSGVKLATLRKFEQSGLISLSSFLKLLSILGGLDKMVDALKPVDPVFHSIDEVIKLSNRPKRKRGNLK